MHAAVLSATRVIQGRLNDLSMLAAAHAKRSPDGGYTPEASAALASIGRFKRLFIIVFYATVSRAHAPLRSCCSPRRPGGATTRSWGGCTRPSWRARPAAFSACRT